MDINLISKLLSDFNFSIDYSGDFVGYAWLFVTVHTFIILETCELHQDKINDRIL
jgi:hypothetical protein